MQPSTQPPLATSATSDRAGAGSGIGAVRRPRPAWVVCGGCRLKAAFPDRVRRPRSAWLPAEGRQALGPAWPQPAAPPMHRPAAQAVGSKLARAKLDLGRGRWMRGNAERTNGRAKDLSGRNTFFICDTDERGLGLEENLRLFSLILAYLRLMGEKCLRPAFDCSEPLSAIRLYPGFGERGKILHQIHQFLRGHRLLQSGRHDGELRLFASDDVALAIAGDDAADRLDGDFVRGVAHDQTVSFVAGFQGELPGLITEGDARARIQDRLVQRVLAQFTADLGKVRTEFDPLPVDL